jgi:hypothetical protein
MISAYKQSGKTWGNICRNQNQVYNFPLFLSSYINASARDINSSMEEGLWESL